MGGVRDRQADAVRIRRRARCGAPVQRVSVRAIVSACLRARRGDRQSAEHLRAAFDAVGPLLLIGWADAGTPAAPGDRLGHTEGDCITCDQPNPVPGPTTMSSLSVSGRKMPGHWQTHRQPTSAETLRPRPRIGAARSRSLVRPLACRKRA
jgi:hypothetical protein